MEDVAPGLVDRVLARDYTVTLAAGEAGAIAAPALVRLVDDDSADVRELALLCLVETGGPGAPEAFVRSLLDPGVLVRAAAMRGLLAHADAAGPLVSALLDAYDRSDEPVVCENVALILGKVPGAPEDELRRRYKREADPLIEEAWLAALARLGDADARGAFGKRLLACSGRDRVRLLERAEYIAQPWLLRSLTPLLDDLTRALYVGVDGVPRLTQYLRVCDLAVNLAATLGALTLSFAVDGLTNYAPGQIDEVRALLDA